MASLYNLHHWDNSHPKCWLVVLLCAFKNDIYLVLDQNHPTATFQTRKTKDGLLFQKLATAPQFAGRGIGSFCLNEIERIGRKHHCADVICEVYDQSKNAIEFYKHKGFSVYGSCETLKYSELKMIKKL